MRTLLTTVVAMAVAGAGLAQACSCIPPPPPKKALEQAHAVFSGKVTKIEEAGEGELSVTLELATTWKGAADKELTLFTANQSAACGYGFEKGKTYLVYAHQIKRGEAKVLETNICTRTALLADAKDDLKDLGAGKKVPK
jgi:hypothetical protein